MKSTFITILFTNIILISCTSKKTFNKKIQAKHSPKELREDLKIVRNSLEKYHPGLYWYIDKDNLSYKFDSLSHLLVDSLTSLVFYRELAPIVAAVKCGHTRLAFPNLKASKFQKDSIKKTGGKPLSQLYFFVDSNRLFIRDVKKKELQEALQFTEVLEIDGVSASFIINKTKSLFASDGYNQTFYPKVLSKSFDAFYYLSFGKSDSSKLNLRRGDSTYSYVLKTIKPVKEKKNLATLHNIGNKNVDKQAEKLKRKNRYKGLDEFGEPILDLRYDSLLEKTAILKVKSFAFKKSNFRRFFRESFKDLKANKTEHLILDLRNNGGGDLMACNRLFRYLYDKPHQFTGKAYTKNSFLKAVRYEDKPITVKVARMLTFPVSLLTKVLFERHDPEGYYTYIPTDHKKSALKDVFNGELVVLINGYSFSAAALLSANLKSVKRGLFIGEETGGGYNQCSAGRIPFINLPNTGLKLRLPLKVIQITNRRTLEGRGVFPDLEVREKVEDVLNKRDLYMKKATSCYKNSN